MYIQINNLDYLFLLRVFSGHNFFVPLKYGKQNYGLPNGKQSLSIGKRVTYLFPLSAQYTLRNRLPYSPWKWTATRVQYCLAVIFCSIEVGTFPIGLL